MKLDSYPAGPCGREAAATDQRVTERGGCQTAARPPLLKVRGFAAPPRDGCAFVRPIPWDHGTYQGNLA